MMGIVEIVRDFVFAAVLGWIGIVVEPKSPPQAPQSESAACPSSGVVGLSCTSKPGFFTGDCREAR
ncbi:MAG: hypothetical protein KJS97_05870 [Alphaproteobacteria bacterium]|nr:hypothetical protein [Alphaproteobacteria bacterium]